MKKIVVGLSGASGIDLGLRFVKVMRDYAICYVVVSDCARIVWEKEKSRDLLQEISDLKIKVYTQEEIWAGIASGSFGIEAMIIVPTSMNLLAKIAYGIADELLSRCASVILKEKKQLVLAPREMPISSIALENMLRLSNLGVVIAPPILGYYAKIQTLEEMENFLIGKWLDVLGIENALYHRWEDKE